MNGPDTCAVCRYSVGITSEAGDQHLICSHSGEYFLDRVTRGFRCDNFHRSPVAEYRYCADCEYCRPIVDQRNEPHFICHHTEGRFLNECPLMDKCDNFNSTGRKAGK